jgi:hypothetical protein
LPPPATSPATRRGRPPAALSEKNEPISACGKRTFRKQGLQNRARARKNHPRKCISILDTKLHTAAACQIQDMLPNVARTAVFRFTSLQLPALCCTF